MGGTVGQNPRKDFLESLAYFNITVSGVFIGNNSPSFVQLSNGNNVPNVGTNDNLNNMTPAQFAVFALEVVKAIWNIEHPDYVDINTVEGALIALYNADTHPTSLGSVIS